VFLKVLSTATIAFDQMDQALQVLEQAVLKIHLQFVREGKCISDSLEVTGMNLGKEKNNITGDGNCFRKIT